MKSEKKKKLEATGWKIGDSIEFLNLTPEEAAYVELKVILSKKLQAARMKKKLTQIQLAQMIKSSQSRVAKMEAGDPSVSLDLLIRTLLLLGTSRKTLSQAIA